MNTHTFHILVWFMLWSPLLGWGTPGPESTLLVINQRNAESVSVGAYYAQRRHIAPSFQCEIYVDPEAQIAHDTFDLQVTQPVLDCIARHSTRIEAIVLTRGIPLRVAINRTDRTEGSPALTISSASLLTVAQSYKLGVSLAAPEHGELFAELTTCGAAGSCWTPLIENPWRSGHFSPRWFDLNQGIAWAPLWVTRLDAYTLEDIWLMIDRAVESDRALDAPRPAGTALLMRGANAPRAVRDYEFSSLQEALDDLGVASELVEFNAEYQHPTPLSAFVTGSATLGAVIEDQRFIPGAIVDNLTSFGAHPNNFDPNADEMQTSIARWISRGVAGVHGTTDEPLNLSFPSRAFLLDYMRGASLSEAFSRHIPYLAWQNLILGDPMMAPYMRRPRITFSLSERGEASVRVEVAEGQRVSELSVWSDNAMVERVATPMTSVCLERGGSVLAVAQTAPESSSEPDESESASFGGGFASGYAKGWATLTLPPCGLDIDLDVDAGGDRSNREMGRDVALSDMGGDLGVNGETLRDRSGSSDHSEMSGHKLDEPIPAVGDLSVEQSDPLTRGGRDEGCVQRAPIFGQSFPSLMFFTLCVYWSLRSSPPLKGVRHLVRCAAGRVWLSIKQNTSS